MQNLTEKRDNMKGKIIGFLRENILIFSIIAIIVGAIIIIIGLFGIFFQDEMNFIIKEIETNKRSEFIKKHVELKNSVRYLPSKYKSMLKQKEKELKIK